VDDSTEIYNNESLFSLEFTVIIKKPEKINKTTNRKVFLNEDFKKFFFMQGQ